MVVKKKAPNGACQEFFEKAVSYRGNKCLIWPYRKSSRSFPRMWIDTSSGHKQVVVPRAICEAVYGPPETAEHQVSHSCRNAQNGCVAPKHLRWSFRPENIFDSRGEKNNMSKITSKDVKIIRSLAGKISQNDIADKFGMTQANASSIINRKTWKHI